MLSHLNPIITNYLINRSKNGIKNKSPSGSGLRESFQLKKKYFFKKNYIFLIGPKKRDSKWTFNMKFNNAYKNYFNSLQNLIP